MAYKTIKWSDFGISQVRPRGNLGVGKFPICTVSRR